MVKLKEPPNNQHKGESEEMHAKSSERVVEVNGKRSGEGDAEKNEGSCSSPCSSSSATGSARQGPQIGEEKLDSEKGSVRKGKNKASKGPIRENGRGSKAKDGHTDRNGMKSGHDAEINSAANTRSAPATAATTSSPVTENGAEGIRKEFGGQDERFKGETRHERRKGRTGKGKWNERGLKGLLLQVKRWADREPSLVALKLAVLHMLDRVKFEYVNRMREKIDPLVRQYWPIISTWLLAFLHLTLMLGLVAFECGIRGLTSIFRLGSAALFLTLWCAVLGLIVLAGFFNFFLALVVTVAAAFFLGYSAALVTLGLFSTIVLWIYGSFWITGMVVLIAGGSFFIDRTKAGTFIVMLYSIYSAKGHGGWLGLVLCFNLAFISNDLVIYVLNNIDEKRTRSSEGQQSGKSNKGKQEEYPSGTTSSYPESRSVPFPSGESSESSRNCDDPSQSGSSECDPISPDEEVKRVLACKDHYAVLGFPRFENFDLLILKREYRKKAMLVHPDKNRGNGKAEEAFKRLQNAYEVLLDATKRRGYDDELKRTDLIMSFRRHFGFHKDGQCESAECRCHDSDDEIEHDIPPDARQVVCKNCNMTHVWIRTLKSKQKARWCQECQDHHAAKDGDGWVEQHGHSFFYGIFHKVGLPRAYACAAGNVYDVTEWAVCQGMKCAANTHKPSFHVSTVASGKSTARAGKSPKGSQADGFPFADMEENMTEEDFFQWLENAIASGLFSDGFPTSSPGKPMSRNKQQNRKKKKGKKQW